MHICIYIYDLVAWGLKAGDALRFVPPRLKQTPSSPLPCVQFGVRGCGLGIELPQVFDHGLSREFMDYRGHEEGTTSNVSKAVT